MSIAEMPVSTLTVSVVVVGMAVVFLILILLSVLINLFGRMMGKASPKKDASPVVVSQVPAVVVTPPSTKQDIDEEVLAVIAAAVAAYSQQTGVQYQVRKVSRSKVRSSWGFAALRHNTNPF